MHALAFPRDFEEITNHKSYLSNQFADVQGTEKNGDKSKTERRVHRKMKKKRNSE